MYRCLIWSIQHTGTFFCSFLIASSVPRENQLHFGSLYQRHIDMGHKRHDISAPFDFSDYAPVRDKITVEWFDQYITSLRHGPKPEQDADLSAVDLEKIDILVAHDHHHKVGSQLIENVRRNKPEVPFIVPMRDPLLSLHSKMWREAEIYDKPDKDSKRMQRAMRCVDLYVDLLSVPDGHLFYLPMDTDRTNTEEGKIQLAREAHEFAGIEFTDRARKFACKWKAKNTTKKLVKNKGREPDARWGELKKNYLAGNIDPVKKAMKIEFEYLHEQDELKELLQKVGYKELPWW